MIIRRLDDCTEIQFSDSELHLLRCALSSASTTGYFLSQTETDNEKKEEYKSRSIEFDQLLAGLPFSS